MTAIKLDAEGRAAVKEIIASMAQTQAALAPLSEALDAMVDGMVELLGGDLSDATYERARRAVVIIGGIDFTTFMAALDKAGPVLERSLLRENRRG